MIKFKKCIKTIIYKYQKKILNEAIHKINSRRKIILT